MILTAPTASSSLEEWLIWQEKNHPSEIDMGLERVRTVAERLGVLNPSARVITVAGTNGKGSCIASLEVLLARAGKSFGAYTSPHFLKYNERVRLHGQPVSDELLVDAFTRIYRACGDISLTYFEFGTLAAMVIFNDCPLDYWLLEVGLGGRLDAVNVVDPSIAVITSIAIDHEAWLGNSREKIGFEKVGICRRNAPLICADQEPPQSVRDFVQSLGCSVKWRGKDFSVQQEAVSTRLILSSGQQLVIPRLHLPAPSVVAALEVMIEEHLLEDERATIDSLQAVYLTGRMQHVELAGAPAVLDVAHNPAAAELLAQRLLREGGRYRAVVAMMADKDMVAVLRPLLPLVNSWHCASLPDNERAASASMLAKILTHDLGVSDQSIKCWPSVENALTGLVQQDHVETKPLLVFGSFFTVAEALSYSGK